VNTKDINKTNDRTPDGHFYSKINERPAPSGYRYAEDGELVPVEDLNRNRPGPEAGYENGGEAVPITDFDFDQVDRDLGYDPSLKEAGDNLELPVFDPEDARKFLGILQWLSGARTPQAMMLRTVAMIWSGAPQLLLPDNKLNKVAERYGTSAASLSMHLAQLRRGLANGRNIGHQRTDTTRARMAEAHRKTKKPDAEHPANDVSH